MEKFFRFGLTNEDTAWSIGFLQGIDEVRLPKTVEIELLEAFQSLPCPHLPYHCEFWFTESGLKRYAAALVNVLRAVLPMGYQLTYMEKESDEDIRRHCLYRDDWQAAWEIEFLQTDKLRFRAVESIEFFGDGSCIIHTF